MEFWIKVLIFIAILVITYFVLEYFWEINYLEMAWESIVDLIDAFRNLEWNPVALGLTITFSSIIWIILWGTPFWSTIPLEQCGRFLICMRSLPHKIFFSIGTPLIGYVLVNRRLNNE